MPDFTTIAGIVSAVVVAILAVAGGYYKLRSLRLSAKIEERPSVPPDSGRPRVLIVDDNREVLAALRMALNGDFEVRAFEFSHDALRKLIECHENHKPFDAAIIDYNLHGIDGGQIVRIIRLLFPKTKIAFISGTALIISAQSQRLVDVTWRKPQDVVRLREKVLKLIEKG